jgi:hypothetical protein
MSAPRTVRTEAPRTRLEVGLVAKARGDRSGARSRALDRWIKRADASTAVPVVPCVSARNSTTRRLAATPPSPSAPRQPTNTDADLSSRPSSPFCSSQQQSWPCKRWRTSSRRHLALSVWIKCSLTTSGTSRSPTTARRFSSSWRWSTPRRRYGRPRSEKKNGLASLCLTFEDFLDSKKTTRREQAACLADRRIFHLPRVFPGSTLSPCTPGDTY